MLKNMFEDSRSNAPRSPLCYVLGCCITGSKMCWLFQRNLSSSKCIRALPSACLALMRGRQLADRRIG